MSASQFHFEFNEWEEAFAMYRRKHCGERFYDETGRYLGKRKGDPSIMLLISTAPETSGYWIERDAEPDEYTHIYLSLREVKNLERRVRRRIANSQSHATGLIL